MYMHDLCLFLYMQQEYASALLQVKIPDEETVCGASVLYDVAYAAKHIF